MKRTKKDYPSFNLFSIVGTWESVNLNPTVIIYRNDKEYLLSIIYVSETTKQASPATYEVQKDGSILKHVNRLRLLLMRYSKMVASILLLLRPNGSM